MELMKTINKGKIMCIENIVLSDWAKRENISFDKEIRCYRLVVDERTYDILGPIGTMHQIDQKSGSGNGKAIHSVVHNPRFFLDNSKMDTIIVIPYGFWTCDCSKGFVRTPYSSECPTCKCSIVNETRRAAYLEDINFV
jgi:hypothetical protein